MKNTKGILAAGVILLFLGLACSPVTAQTTLKDRLQIGTIGDIPSLQITENDISIMEKFLPALFEQMQTATSHSQVVNVLQGFMKEYGRHPVLVFMLKLLIKGIDFNFNINQLRPIRKTAFIMSMGFTNKYFSFAKNSVNVARPLTSWFYSGRSNMMINSRTIILDPYPFSFRMLDGRQIGFMVNFVGLYIHFSGRTDRAKTFFFGYAGTIRGFDLSPLNK